MKFPDLALSLMPWHIGLQAKRGETCVYCRAAWTQPLPGVASSSKASMSEGYLNLAGAVGASSRRDTSTCKSGTPFQSPLFLLLTLDLRVHRLPWAASWAAILRLRLRSLQ